MPEVDESTVESAALAYFADLGYTVAHGPDLAPDSPHAERSSYADVVLAGRLRAALARINPHIPADAREEAVRRVLHPESPSLHVANHQFHRLLTEGVPVQYRAAEGRVLHDTLWLADFANPAANDWLVVNQFTTVAAHAGRPAAQRRPDIVVFLNGLPLGLIELKNPTDANATVQGAFRQLQTYQRDLPALFPYNEVLVVSDGLAARIGTLTSDWERFMPWRTIDGDDLAPKGTPELEVLIKGVFEKRRFLDLLRHFVVYETDGPVIQRKLAGYHQYHAVNKAIGTTIQAADPHGNRRAGVVWHTQGSGKSLTMTFYAGKIVQEPALANPTLVVLTDRNDLDGPVRHLRRLPGTTEADAGAGGEPGGCAAAAPGRGFRRHHLHDHPEVPAGDERGALPLAQRPPQYRRDRRRGAPQPVRLHRRLRPPHPRSAAQRLLPGLHRHADRSGRPQHHRRLR